MVDFVQQLLDTYGARLGRQVCLIKQTVIDQLLYVTNVAQHKDTTEREQKESVERRKTALLDNSINQTSVFCSSILTVNI